MQEVNLWHFGVVLQDAAIAFFQVQRYKKNRRNARK
jgi:hypothetical protein